MGFLDWLRGESKRPTKDQKDKKMDLANNATGRAVGK